MLTPFQNMVKQANAIDSKDTNKMAPENQITQRVTLFSVTL